MNILKSVVLLLCSLFILPVLAAGGGGSNTSAPAEPVPEEILQLIEAEDYAAAVPELERFVGREKRSADGWNLLGYSQRQTGALEASLKSYKKALRLDRKHLGANEYIGELYLQMDRPKKARKYLKRLARYCDDCEEYRDLKAAVEAYESGG